MVARAELVGQVTSEDPAIGLRAVASLWSLLEAVEELQVKAARDGGLDLARDRVRARRLEAGRASEVRQGTASAAAEASMRFLPRRRKSS